VSSWFFSREVKKEKIFLKLSARRPTRLRAGVNFTNISWAAFAPKSFWQTITNPNCKHLKTVQRTLVWLSISPIFYKQLFHTKVLCALFMCLQFGFVFFWRKDLGAKAAYKMLVKLTPGQKKTCNIFSYIYMITLSCLRKPSLVLSCTMVILGYHEGSRNVQVILFLTVTS